MRNSLKKLRGLGLNKFDKRERNHRQHSLAQLDELAQASQDMYDMRDCYDGLLSAAAATANSAFEFSESLREMGDCLLEKTALNDDEESGQVLLMLGKVQFEIQKLIDNYRSHLSQTITVPSESLLNELRIVEEMKNICDNKRQLYDHMRARYREKGRLRGNKGEFVSSHQLQTAHDEYDECASLFVFRMKSLKQGQSRSLLTQATRHHAAQLCLFRKAVKALEAIEPHVKLVTEQQHIDYQFSGLEDDNLDNGDNGDDEDYEDDDESEMYDDGELSFDYGQNDPLQDVATSRSSLEVDSGDLTFPQVKGNAAKENKDQNHSGLFVALGRNLRTSSKSAPLFAEKKTDPADKFNPIQPVSTQKFHTYVLPTPTETKSPVSSRSDSQIPQTKRNGLSGGALNLWHSSPLQQSKYENLKNKKFSGPFVPKTMSILKESNNNTTLHRSPPPSTEGLSLPQLNPRGPSDYKKFKRQAFSGPILTASGSIVSPGYPHLISGSILHTPMNRPASLTKLSSMASPTRASSPKISELHELPKPPPHLASKKPANLVSHSSISNSKEQDFSATRRLAGSNLASTLPSPPQVIARSYSIPTTAQKDTALYVPGPLESPSDLKMVQGMASPPLTPISSSNI